MNYWLIDETINELIIEIIDRIIKISYMIKYLKIKKLK